MADDKKTIDPALEQAPPPVPERPLSLEDALTLATDEQRETYAFRKRRYDEAPHVTQYVEELRGILLDIGAEVTL